MEDGRFVPAHGGRYKSYGKNGEGVGDSAGFQKETWNSGMGLWAGSFT